MKPQVLLTSIFWIAIQYTSLANTTALHFKYDSLKSNFTKNYEQDSTKSIPKKNNEISLKESEKDKVAKALIIKSQSYTTDSFNYYVYKGLHMTTNRNIRSIGYFALARFYMNNPEHRDSTYYYAKKALEYTDSGNIKNKALVMLTHYFLKKEDYTASKKWNLQALALAQKRNDSANMVFAYQTLAENYTHQDYFSLAIAALEKAIPYISSKTAMGGVIYLKIAELIMTIDEKDPRQVDYLLKAIQFYESKNSLEKNALNCYQGLMTVYFNTGKPEEALKALENFETKVTLFGEKYIAYYTPIIAYNKAWYYQETSKNELAINAFKKVLSTADFNTYKIMHAKGNLQLGKLLFKTNTTLAKEHLLKSLKIFKEYEWNASVIEIYNLLKQINEQEKDYKKALTYANSAQKLSDSLQKIEKNIAIEEFLIKGKTKEKELEIANLQRQKAQIATIYTQEKRLYGLSVLLVIIVLLLVFTFIYFKRKKKNYLQELALSKEKEFLVLKNTILENMSHEIRTPISIINGYLHLIKQQNIHSPETGRFADLATKNSNNILTTFNNFLNVISNQPQNLQIVPKTKNLDRFFTAIMESFSGYASIKNSGLYYQTNFNDTLSIAFDFEKLDKITTNLLSNAIKYNNTQKNVYVAVSVDETTLTLVVKDEGIGISKEELGSIFDRFYQSKKHNVTGGFGIGLSFVKELVTLLKGTIAVDSEENLGTVFTVKLPIVTNNIALHLKDLKPTYEPISVILDTVKNENNFPKILLVEDNLEMIAYLKEILTGIYNCTVAFNGAEALEMVKTAPFDLIISDYKMPVMNGLDFKKELNKVKNYEKIPFLLLTAFTFNDVEKLQLRLGIEDYVAKPFTYYELLTRLRKLLENTLHLKAIENIEEPAIIDGHVAELIEKMKKLVLANLSNSDYSIADLASDCNYGQKQLGRIIKGSTGLNPVQLILEIKLQKAYELILKNKYATLMEVIYAIGLNNRSYFNKKFIERFGIKPSELMNKYSNT